MSIDRERLALDFVRINEEVWGNLTDQQYLWTLPQVQHHFLICPELLYCAFQDGKMVATLTGIITTPEDLHQNKSWFDKTGNGFLTTHNSKGSIAFGVDLSVVKNAANKISDRLVLTSLFIVLFGESLESVYLGSRIPSYWKHQHLPVGKYVYSLRKTGKPRDPELYFYLKNGFKIVEIIPEYMEDPKSLNYGVLIKWNNSLYQITKRLPFVAYLIKKMGEAMLLECPKDLYQRKGLS